MAPSSVSTASTVTAPSSVSTASTVTQGPVTLPLFKLSHCTTPNPQAKMIWTHLPQRSDMFAVFDVIRKLGIDTVASEIKVLKLVRGGELLEQVEFPDLQDQVRMDEERAVTQNIPDSHLRVIVIVKRPLLALRYALPDGQIRKTQMNFVPSSNCDVALENLRAAGLPIRDRDKPRLQDQRPQSAPSQSRLQERPGSLNAGQVALSQSSQGAFPGSSQPLSQEGAKILDAGHSVPSALKSTKVNARPTSAPSGVNQDEFSRPISASSQSSLDAFRSTSATTITPAVIKPGTRSGLLPSPVFNGTYEPFNSVEVRPMSAPEPTQAQENYTNTLSVSQMLPPERTTPFPKKKIHPSKRDEASSQEDISQQKPAPKTIVRRQTKPRAQPAKPTKPRAKRRATNTSSKPIAPRSPSPELRETGKAPSSSAPPKTRAKTMAVPNDVTRRVPSPEVQATQSSSQPQAQPSQSRKRSLTDLSINQPNKRQAPNSNDTTRDNTPEALTTAVPEQPLPGQPLQGTDPHLIIRNQDLLDTIDNFIRKYHDLPAPKPPPQTAKEQLAVYAVQSEEDRAKAIDNMICTCLEDENFGTLMEDIEGAWKRIGMGL